MGIYRDKPCYGYTKRHQGCHSTCEEGLAQEKVFRQIREARSLEREIDAYTAAKQRAKDRSKWEMKRNGVR